MLKSIQEAEKKINSRKTFQQDVRPVDRMKAAALAVVICLAATALSTMAMAQTGQTAWAWGDNGSGQLGNGTTGGLSNVPVQVALPTSVAAIAAGHGHSLAIKDDGTIWAWGDHTWGQLGTGSGGGGWPGLSNVPVQVSSATGLGGGTAIAASGWRSLVLDGNAVWGWGYNFEGAVGNGTGNNDINIPVQASFPSETVITSVAGGNDHSLAIQDNGTVWSWGSNSYGTLGDGTFVQARTTPNQLPGIAGVIAIAGGANHSLALRNDGTVWSWGWNGYCELGDGTPCGEPSYSNVPVQVLGLTGVTAIAAGWYHSLALRSDGTVWAWGQDWYGQLGSGAPGNSNVPVQVPGLTGVIAIAAGYGHSLALKSDGTLWAWGSNGSGELGNGTSGSNTNSSIPAQVSSLTGVTAVAAGSDFSLALTSPLPPEAAGGDTPAAAQTWSDKDTQSWPSSAGATSYRIYRGQQADLPNLLNSSTDSCVRYEGTSASVTVSDDPATLGAGDFYWYILVGVNGSGEGSAGHALLGCQSTSRIVNATGVCY